VFLPLPLNPEHATRYRKFDVEAMTAIACQSVGAKPCVSFDKIGEGELNILGTVHESNGRGILAGAYNKVFLLKFDNESEAIVRITCLNVGNHHLVTASEVATMDYVRSVLKIPCPRVISGVQMRIYSNTNAAGTEFIIMEKEWNIEFRYRTLKYSSHRHTAQ
jgi:hypothetical protein